MSKATTAPVAQSPINTFEMPPVECGQCVLWSYGPGQPASPALVLKVATRTLTVAVHVDGTKDHFLRSGVRHTLDPFLKVSPQNDMGVWDLTPRDKRLNALLESLGGPVGEE